MSSIASLSAPRRCALRSFDNKMAYTLSSLRSRAPPPGGAGSAASASLCGGDRSRPFSASSRSQVNEGRTQQYTLESLRSPPTWLWRRFFGARVGDLVVCKASPPRRARSAFLTASVISDPCPCPCSCVPASRDRADGPPPAPPAAGCSAAAGAQGFPLSLLRRVFIDYTQSHQDLPAAAAGLAARLSPIRETDAVAVASP